MSGEPAIGNAEGNRRTELAAGRSDRGLALGGRSCVRSSGPNSRLQVLAEAGPELARQWSEASDFGRRGAKCQVIVLSELHEHLVQGVGDFRVAFATREPLQGLGDFSGAESADSDARRVINGGDPLQQNQAQLDSLSIILHRGCPASVMRDLGQGLGAKAFFHGLLATRSLLHRKLFILPRSSRLPTSDRRRAVGISGDRRRRPGQCRR